MAVIPSRKAMLNNIITLMSTLGLAKQVLYSPFLVKLSIVEYLGLSTFKISSLNTNTIKI